MSSVLAAVISNDQEELLREWTQQQLNADGMRRDLIKIEELEAQSRDFLHRLHGAATSGDFNNIRMAAWAPVLEMLGELSRQRGRMGFSPTETALFVLSLRAPLSRRLREAFKGDPDGYIDEMAGVGELLDKLGLYTMELFQKSREEVIIRQQEDMLELSTPVVKLWDGIVALPIIGTLDSARTSVVMESLLQRIVETGSEIAIIDITGVPTVDTLVAQHLLKTVAAARLMGADCIISGIRPQIAQTMVHLAIDLSAVTTKATLAEALKTALQRNGMRVVANSPA